VQQYRWRERTFITAVRLDLNMDGFTYLKWGGTQRCKRGDWLVNNQGDVYTIDAGLSWTVRKDRSSLGRSRGRTGHDSDQGKDPPRISPATISYSMLGP
jgi:hypothetical protein